jgi:exportin-7
VYIIGSAISGRISYTHDEHDLLDGDLIIRVLQLMTLTDSRLPSGSGCEKLELAIMCFLEQVRKIYINEHMTKLKIFKRLSEVLGVNDETTLLTVISRKM